MRRAETSGWIAKGSSVALLRLLRLAVVPFSIGLVVTTGAARAADDGSTFSERIMEGFYGAIRGTNMDNRGIDYRERSPLVVPPSLDLPPPASAAAEAQVPNWPKDPDERQRKAIIAAKKKNAPPPARVMVMTADGKPVAGAQPINIAPPAEDGTQPAANTGRPAYASDRNGSALTDPVYDQAGDLFNGGFTKSLGWGDSLGIGNLFGSKGDSVAIQPGTEPARQALTQPPPGYQTPSTNYDYGLVPRGLLDGKPNPDRNPLSQRSSETSVVH